MAQPTLTVKDGSGVAQTIFTQNPNGASIAANGTPIAFPTDQLALVSEAIFFNESTTPIAGAATFTGLARDIGVVPGVSAYACIFNAFILTDQTGVMRIEISNDNITWRRATIDTAIAANVPLFTSTKVVARYHRVVIVNGVTIQGFVMINTSYTSA